MHKRATWIPALLAALCLLGWSAIAAGAAATRPATSASSPAGAAERYQVAGALAVESAEYDWHDKARDRDVPAKVYYPRGGDGNLPVIIFSHGLGGSREGYAYLGRHWAGYGYVCVHLTHVGSDTGVLKAASQPMDAMRAAAANPMNAVQRARDVSFAIDELAEMNKSDSRLKGRLDMERIGLAGHSFGGHTVLACAGLSGGLVAGSRSLLAEARIKAAIAMSAPARPLDKQRLDRMYGGIRIPLFHMTGTKDDSPIGDTKAEDRRVPFDHITGADQYLLILQDGDHMVFSGRLGVGADRPGDARRRELILAGSTAFWDAYLKGDAAAKKSLAVGDYKAAVGKDGTFEEKLKAVPASAPAPK